MMESPIWVCAFMNLGHTILSDASMISPSFASLEISMMLFSSSRTMFSFTGLKSMPFRINPFAIVFIINNFKISFIYFYLKKIRKNIKKFNIALFKKN